MPFHVSPRTLEVLQWPELLERLARHVRTPGGLVRCAPTGDQEDPDTGPQLRLLEGSRQAARDRLAETGEARALLDDGHDPALGGLPDLRLVLRRLARQGTLTTGELLDLAALLAALTALRRFGEARAERAPRLAGRAADIPDLRDLDEAIRFALGPEGELRDEASPVLAEARRSTRRLASEVQRRLDALLRDPDVTAALSDRYHTLRNDRFVLPVRADARGRVRGIVHDASGSGTTLFVEPEAVVELNNQLKSAELAVEREVRRILRDLSAQAAAERLRIEAGLDALEDLDLAFARGRLSQELEAVAPEVGEDGVFRLRQLRHPLIAPDEAVPNDLLLGDGPHVLVISGPNAGGKTVALKALALAALCVRAGLHVAAAPGSRVDLVDAVLADIGDAQDLHEHLSTFSAHLANLAAITRAAGPASLVVLDEVGVGTDPGEGAAIAQATLETLADAGARVVATTHYNLLKEMAEVDPRFENASVEFDAETGAPTYRLRTGAAGVSSALAVAARMGLPRAALERANALLDREDRRLDRMLAELSASRATLERERRQARALRAESEQARDDYRQKLERLQERRDALFGRMRADLDAAFRDAHAEVAAVIRDLQRGGGARAAAHARDRLLALESRSQEAQRRADARAPAPEEGAPWDWRSAKPGDAVRLAGGGRGVLVTLPDRRGRATVRVGDARLQVPAERVRADAPTPAERPHPAPIRAPVPPVAGGSARCDLRGLRVDEALARIAAELDGAAAAGRERLVIVHGHGTGALRDAVRRELHGSPYLETLHAADPEEGGEGVTIAELRR